MITDIKRLDMSLPIGSIQAYNAWVNRLPMLSEDEERELTNRLYYHNDVEAARKLIMAHLRFVVKIARGYGGYGLQQADLIQEGNIGLMKAVKRFNPEVGVRLVSFAIHWIKAEIHEFVIRNWRIVKVATTKAQRKLFFNLRKMSKKLGWLSNGDAKNIAETLNVREKDVRTMEKRLHAYDEAFDYRDSDDDDFNFSPSQYLEDHSNNPEQLVEAEETHARNQALLSAMEQLDDRSQDILQQRWLTDDKATLHDLAAKYAISAERIRQLEQAAMKKIKNLFAATA